MKRQAAGTSTQDYATINPADLQTYQVTELLGQPPGMDDRADPVVAMVVNKKVAERLAFIFGTVEEGLASWMAGIQIIGSDRIPARFLGLRRQSGAVEIIDSMNYPRGTMSEKSQETYKQRKLNQAMREAAEQGGFQPPIPGGICPFCSTAKRAVVHAAGDPCPNDPNEIPFER